MSDMFGAVLKYRGATPKMAARERNAIQKDAFIETLTYWHTHHRQKHFTNAGAVEYGYLPRSGDRGSRRKFVGSYTQRKLLKFGHTRPLEFSGASRALSANRNVKATSKTARCIISAPALNFRNPKSPIRMREEMTRVSPAERIELVNHFEEYMLERFNKITASETKTM